MGHGHGEGMAAHQQRTEKSATLILNAALEMAALPPERQLVIVQPEVKSGPVSRISICQDKPTAARGECLVYRSDNGSVPAGDGMVCGMQ
jgi:hypothetical protein